MAKGSRGKKPHRSSAKGAQRERRPALLGAPRPRPPPRPQPLPAPSEIVPAVSAPAKPRKQRVRLTDYDKLVAGVKRSAESGKRPAEDRDEPRPAKIAAKEAATEESEEEGHSEQPQSTAASDAENVPETEGAGNDEQEDEAILEQDLKAAGVETTPKNDAYRAHYDRELTPAELSALEQPVRWESLRDPSFGSVQSSGPLPAAVPAGTPLARFGIKQRVAEQWHETALSAAEARLLQLLTDHRDVMFTGRSGGALTPQRLRALYMLHAVNHVAKARDAVLTHNARLNAIEAGGERPELRDQGFSRPRVLVLLPFRQAAVECVDMLLKLAPKAQLKEVAYRKRFNTEYGPDEDEDEDETHADKPADHVATFKGNTDDCFRLGVAFSRSSVRLYTEFYASDMIIASPLGLRLVLDSPETDKRDHDFLSSIELVVIDQADVLYMQNWEHLEIIFSHINLIPKKAHSTTDFSRVRNWELNGLGRHYRQTVLLSSFGSVELNAIFNRQCANHTGRVKLLGNSVGVVTEVVRQVKQVFQRLDPPTLEAADEVRIQYLSEHLLPRLRAAAQDHTLVFVPSYFDYVRVRNLFQKLADENELTFCKVSEYTKAPEVARGRTFFADGRAQFMLYTERAHFYHRFRIRGVKHLILFGLPHYAHFYTELLNMLTGTDISCLVLYTRFEAFELERVVGEKRCDIMLRSSQNTHLITAT